MKGFTPFTSRLGICSLPLAHVSRPVWHSDRREILGGVRWYSLLVQLPAAQLTFNSCPTVDKAVKDVMQCLPVAVFTVKQVTNSRSTSSSRFWRYREVLHKRVEVWVAMRRALKVTMGADTYHDFQPAVGVMRAVSTPWQGATRHIGNSLLECRIHPYRLS